MVAITSTITPRIAATPPTRDKCSSDGISVYAAQRILVESLVVNLDDKLVDFLVDSNTAGF